MRGSSNTTGIDFCDFQIQRSTIYFSLGRMSKTKMHTKHQPRILARFNNILSMQYYILSIQLFWAVVHVSLTTYAAYEILLWRFSYSVNAVTFDWQAVLVAIEFRRLLLPEFLSYTKIMALSLSLVAWIIDWVKSKICLNVYLWAVISYPFYIRLCYRIQHRSHWKLLK